MENKEFDEGRIDSNPKRHKTENKTAILELPEIPKHKIKNIMKENDLKIDVSEKSINAVRSGVSRMLSSFIRKGIEICKENKRKTLFLSDLKEAALRNHQFSFLIDVLNEEFVENEIKKTKKVANENEDNVENKIGQ